MKNLLSTLENWLESNTSARRRARQWRASTGDFMDTATRDLKNRTLGLQAQLKARAEAGPVDDVVLAERVRARLGRMVSHPRAVKVMTHEGRVSLSGDLLADEVDDLLEAIARIPGVRQVEDHLTLHEAPGAVPALQGGRTRPRSRSHWTPATRLAMGAAGGSLAAYGLARRGLLGVVVGLLGLGVSARAVVNQPVDQLLPKRRRPEETIETEAPKPDLERA